MFRKMIRHNIKIYWRWFLGLVLAFIVILLALYMRMISVRSSALQSESQRKAQAVEIIGTEVTDVWKNMNFLARVEGGQTVTVRSVVSGWVKERNVEIGSVVEKGDTLLTLMDERKDLALKEAESRLIAAKANLRELNRLFRRNVGLFEKGIVAKDTQESLKNQIEAQRAQVDALEAIYKRAEWDYDHLVVTAPIDGRITEVRPDTGQEVMLDEAVVKMVNSTSKRIVAGVDASLARTLKKVEIIKLKNDIVGRIETAEARIIGISPDIDMESGTYSLEAEITSPEVEWLPGEIVNVEAPVERLESVVVIPRSAVLSDNENKFLFIYQDGKAIKRDVEVTWLDDKRGAVNADTIPVSSKIIIKGNTGLVPGQAVRSVNN